MPHGSQADLTVVMVTYQIRELIGACLESVRAASEGLAVDVAIVENGSTDGTLEVIRQEFPELELIDAGENLGFIRGNNVVLDRLVAERSAGRYVLLLNPDTVVRPETFRVMVDFMDAHPEYGGATCRVNLANCALDWACHRGFPTPWSALTHMLGLQKLFPHSRRFARYHLKWLDLDTTHEIDSPTGAFFMVRRETFYRIGGLDTDYFMYGDDLDWAYRIRETGARIAYHPATSIIHYKGVSTGLKGHSARWSRADTVQKIRRSRDFSNAMRIFYDKHLAASDPRPLRWLVRGAIAARRSAETLRYRLEGRLRGA
jgi:GT2 family glycosyltransferase